MGRNGDKILSFIILGLGLASAAVVFIWFGRPELVSPREPAPANHALVETPPDLKPEENGEYDCSGDRRPMQTILLSFAQETFGEWESCRMRIEGTATSRAKIYEVSFSRPAKWTLGYYPPESMSETLELPPGQVDEKKALELLADSTLSIAQDVEINWDEPSSTQEGDVLRKDYWEKEETMNLRAYIEYRNEQMTKIGVSYAL